MNEYTNNTILGFWLYLMSDCVLFAGLFALYAVLQGETFGAGEAAELFNLPFVLLETLILLTSSCTVGLAFVALRAHTKYLTLALLGATLILGLTFLGLEVSEFRQLILEGHGPSASAFLSSFFALVGTHGLHIAVGSIWMIALMIRITFTPMRDDVHHKLLCLSLFWHFLDIVWICIFTFVYLFGVLA